MGDKREEGQLQETVNLQQSYTSNLKIMKSDASILMLPADSPRKRMTVSCLLQVRPAMEHNTGGAIMRDTVHELFILPGA